MLPGLKEVIRLGNRLLRARRYDEGIHVLERNIDRYPDQPRSYWHVGDAYLLSGQPAKARPFMLRALEKAREINAPELDEYERSLAELDAKLH